MRCSVFLVAIIAVLFLNFATVDASPCTISCRVQCSLKKCSSETEAETHKRTKRMWILTDRYSRTPHADSFYQAIFSAERVDKLFTKSENGTLTIRKQNDGVKFDGKTYYWYGLVYSWWNKKSRTCYYPVKEDPEMENVRFPDGSRVKSLMFGCWSWQRCCGTDCCFETALYGIFFFLIALSLCCVAVKKLHQKTKTPASTSENVNQVEVPLNQVQ